MNIAKNKLLGIIIAVLLVLLTLSGCFNTSRTLLPKEYLDREWYFYDKAAGQHHVMTFGSSGRYSYHCRCGEPIGNSDILELYEFEPESGTIILFNNFDSTKETIELISYNEYHLLMRIDGEIRDFIPVEFDSDANFFYEEASAVLDGCNSYCRIADIDGNTIIYAPVGYEPQSASESDLFEEYQLTDDAVFFSLSLSRVVSVEDGLEYEESCDTEFIELSLSDLDAFTEKNSEAFVCFDESINIEKIVFYEEEVIY